VRYFKEMKIIVASPKAMCKFKKGEEKKSGGGPFGLLVYLLMKIRKR